MHPKLEAYLASVERYLKPVSVTERLDIITELRSNLLELQNAGELAPEEIIRQFGPPKELAMSYLADSLTRNPKFSGRQFLKVASFYGMAGFTGMFVLPICSVLSVGLIFCGFIAPLMGLVELITSLVGIDLPFGILQLGPFTPPPILAFPISIVFGGLLLLGGRAVWRAMLRYIRTIGDKKWALQNGVDQSPSDTD